MMIDVCLDGIERTITYPHSAATIHILHTHTTTQQDTHTHINSRTAVTRSRAIEGEKNEQRRGERKRDRYVIGEKEKVERDKRN